MKPLISSFCSSCLALGLLSWMRHSSTLLKRIHKTGKNTRKEIDPLAQAPVECKFFQLHSIVPKPDPYNYLLSTPRLLHGDYDARERDHRTSNTTPIFQIPQNRIKTNISHPCSPEKPRISPKIAKHLRETTQHPSFVLRFVRDRFTHRHPANIIHCKPSCEGVSEKLSPNTEICAFPSS